MKAYNIRKYYISHYIIIISLISIIINSVYTKEMIKNIYDNNELSNIKYFKEGTSSSRPLTFLTDETNLFRKFIVGTLNDQEETSGDPNCLDYLLKTFQNNTLATLKLIQDSSHSLSRLGSYQDCKYKIYYNDSDNSRTDDELNFTYVLFYTPYTAPNIRPTLFSICVPECSDCQNDDYLNILQSFNLKTEFFDTTQLAESQVYILNDEAKKVNDKFYIGIFVIIFFAFILICEIFPLIPVTLFKCCFKKKIISKKNNSKSKKKNSVEIYEISSISNFEKSFDLKESIGEIYGVESNAGINNDSGISFLKGLRGICLMLFILGESLEAVYQYPVKKSEKLYFNTPSLSFLYFFNRFTKNLFLSISSFSLCYKILCYFDNEIERSELKNINIKLDVINPDIINNTFEEREEPNEKKRKKSKKDRKSKDKSKISLEGSKSSENLSGLNLKRNNSGSTSSLSNLSKTGKKSLSSGDLTKMPSISQFNSLITETELYSKISFKSVMVFLFRQFYKYLLFVAIVLIFRYSYYDFVSKIVDNPMWEFIKNSYVNKLTPVHILSFIFLIFPFSFKVNYDVVYDPYDIIILEISLFIIFSFILFLIYKTNLRFDIIVLIMFPIGIGIKIGIYYYILDNTKSVFQEYFYPSKGFTNKDYRFLLNNIFYYIPCISIGLFFGLVNYTIQKSAKSIEQFKDKLYLIIPIQFTNLLKKMPVLYSFIFSIIFIIYFIWCGLSYNLLFLSEDKLNEDLLAIGFYTNNLINIYYSVDVDILIVLIFLAIIPFSLIGENVFISFLEHEYWNILSKPYYSYMLIIQITGTNILYRMNTNVELNLFSILFLAIINFIFGIILGAILYTFFEVPLKKLNKFIFSKKEDNKIEEDNDEVEGEGDIEIFDKEERISDTAL